MVLASGIACGVLWWNLRRTQLTERAQTEAVQAEARARAEQEQRAKALEKDITHLDTQNRQLTTLAQELRSQEARQGSNLTALAQRLAPPSGAGSGPGGGAGLAGDDVANAAGAKAGFSSMMEKMMKDPAMREMLRGQQKAMMNQMYGPLYKDLGLTGDQRQKFSDLLVDSAMAGVEQAGSLFQNNTAEKTGAMKAMSDQQKDLQAGLKSLLGEEKFGQYEEYQKSIAERIQLNQFKQQQEGTDAPLQESQTAQLLQIYKEEKTRVPPVISNDPARNMEAMQSEEVMNSYFAWQEDLNKRVLDRAGQTLSPEQIKEYSAFLQQQLGTQRLGMKMAREMLGSGGGAPAPSTPPVQPVPAK